MNGSTDSPITSSTIHGHPHHKGFDGLDLAALRARPGVKWSRTAPDVIPAWVADMDFPPCPAIAGTLRDLLDRGDLGYPDWLTGTPLRAAFAARMADRFGWQPDPSAVREISDLIQGLQVVLQLATRPGDGVAVHVPTYPPFLASIASMGRRLVPIPMHRRSDAWGFDAAAMDAAVAAGGVRVLLLVNPQNPTGRVFTEPELAAIAEIARRHDLLVVSDEIHADVVYPPHRHLPFAALSDDAGRRTVTITSASKAFNLAGLRSAVMHIGDPAFLAVRDAQPADLFGMPNLFGVHAALAAWSPDAAPWLGMLIEHLDANRRRLVEVLNQRMPGARLMAPEGTYLAWVDVAGLGLGDEAAATFRRGGVRLSRGPDFGPGGEGFVRLNFATSVEVLDQILDRMVSCSGSTV
jgi:cystathionine beta-lyase